MPFHTPGSTSVQFIPALSESMPAIHATQTNNILIFISLIICYTVIHQSVGSHSITTAKPPLPSILTDSSVSDFLTVR